MSSRVRNKLNVKQVEHLKKIGVHSDGGGLYLRIRNPGALGSLLGPSMVNASSWDLGLH